MDQFVIDNEIPRVNFLKLDVEGWEVNILKGAMKTLAQNRIRLVAEVNIQFKAEVCELLKSIGYAVFAGKPVEAKELRNRELILCASNRAEDGNSLNCQSSGFV